MVINLFFIYLERGVRPLLSLFFNWEPKRQQVLVISLVTLLGSQALTAGTPQIVSKHGKRVVVESVEVLAQKKATMENEILRGRHPDFFRQYPSFNEVMSNRNLQRQFMEDAKNYHLQNITREMSLAKTGAAHFSQDSQFATDFTAEEIMNDPVRRKEFRQKTIEYESNFVEIARNNVNGMTYDGYWLTTLLKLAATRVWSAASKEAQDLGMDLKVLAENEIAEQLVSFDDPGTALDTTLGILQTKINAYLQFHASFPEFGGSLPWFLSEDLRPTSDWRDRTPGLDNGEFYWMVFGVWQKLIELRDSGALTTGQQTIVNQLVIDFEKYFNIFTQNQVNIFYDSALGKIRAEVKITIDNEGNVTYSNNSANYFLDDVYEGTMMQLWMAIFSDPADLSDSQIEAFLGDVNYNIVQDTLGYIWEGFWNSTHEEWAFLFLPITDIPFANKLFDTRQQIRTTASAPFGGLHTSINGGPAYVSNLGIPGRPSVHPERADWVSVSAAYPVILNDKIQNEEKPLNEQKFWGDAWELWMLQPRGSNDLTVQSDYGGLESYNLETGEVTYLKTIDGTYLLLLSYCKGTIDESRNVMQDFDFSRDPNRKVYDRFIEIMSARFDRAMQNAGITISDLQGPGHQLPQTQVTLQPPAPPDPTRVTLNVLHD